MAIESFGVISNKEIQQLEKKIGCNLPLDYFQFLENNNGGVVKNSTFYVQELDQKIMMDVFFGINLSRGLDLNFWLKEFEDDLPKNTIIIGKDPGGNFLLLNCQADHQGVYYWDHSLFFEKSTEDNNAFPVAKSFTELLKSFST